MGRPSKIWAAMCLPPLRQYWQQINREDRDREAQVRAERKARDKKRRKCQCKAYKFPHRPGGGLCRHPDPPAICWQDAEATEIAERVAKFRERWGEPDAATMADLVGLTAKPRPYRKRYAGIVRQLARANGLHPIRDRALIVQLMPGVIALAKQVKRKAPRAKYRNMAITETGVQGQWQTAGPMM